MLVMCLWFLTIDPSPLGCLLSTMYKLIKILAQGVLAQGVLGQGGLALGVLAQAGLAQARWAVHLRKEILLLRKVIVFANVRGIA